MAETIKTINPCAECPTGRKYAEEIIKNGSKDIVEYYSALFGDRKDFLAKYCPGHPNGVCKN